MAVTLTHLPLPWEATPSLIDYGVDQTAGTGGVQQRATRLGSRYAVGFPALPALSFACAKQLVAARVAAVASGSTVITSWPQPAFSTAIGAPVVDGAGQGGGTLNVRGLTPSTTALTYGLFFSVVVSRRSYLYMVADGVSVDGTGRAALPLSPWLRAAPADGASLSFASPNIEGFITPAGVDWTVERLLWVGLPNFTITEVA